MYVHMCTHIHKYLHVNARMRIHTHAHVHSICIHTYTCQHAAYTNANEHACACTYIFSLASLLSGAPVRQRGGREENGRGLSGMEAAAAGAGLSDEG